MNVRFMSSNIWGDYFGNEVESREEGLYNVFAKYMPDVLGMQEATESWNASQMFDLLKQVYEFADPKDKTDNNYVPLCWRRDRFRKIECGYIQYADTPDRSKACTWAVLESRQSGIRFAAMTTHFWWKFIGDLEHDAIRVSNARELTEKAKELNRKYRVPVIAFGDLNCRIGNPAPEFLAENGWKFVRDIAVRTDETSSHHGDPVRGDDGRYHGRPTENTFSRSIDHMLLYGNAEPIEFRIITDQDALDATDHSPLLADIVIE